MNRPLTLIHKITHNIYWAHRRAWMWWKYADPYYINVIYIETSEGCNRRCSYCPVSIYKPAYRFERPEHFDLHINRLKELNWEGWLGLIWYNEPLMNPHLPDILRYFKAKLPKVKPFITSNGDLLTIEKAQMYFDIGVDHFIITRHTPHSDKWDANMDKIRKHFGRRRIWYRTSPGQDGWSNRTGLIIPDGPICLADMICHFPEDMVISMDGLATLCCNDYNRTQIVGDLRKQSFKDIYYDPCFVQLRKDLRNGIFNLDTCRKCVGLEK